MPKQKSARGTERLKQKVRNNLQIGQSASRPVSKFNNAMETEQAAAVLLGIHGVVDPTAGSAGPVSTGTFGRTSSLFTGQVQKLSKLRREHLNSVTAQQHCLGVIGQPDATTKCWLCGFDIYFLQKYNLMPEKKRNI